MKEYSIFDIIGPIMIGPSSSHTAGACRIGYTVQNIIKEPIQDVKFILYGSFALTYRGHGTDLALLGGLLGFKQDDERIVDAFKIAKARNVNYTFEKSSEETAHPNTVKIIATTVDGEHWEFIGESIGGGKMQLIQINGIDILFTGLFNTLITHHHDSPGMLARISSAIAAHHINIAQMKLYREAKGEKAIGIIEVDEAIDISALKELAAIEGVYYVKLIEKIYE